MGQAINDTTNDRLNVVLRLKAIRNRRIHDAIILVLWLLFAVLTTQIILLFSAEPIIRSVLPYIVDKKSNGVYTASFENLEVFYTRRSFTLNGFRLIPNKKKYLALKNNKKTKSGLYDIYIPKIELKIVSSYRLFYFRTLKMAELIIKKPKITLTDLPQLKKKKEKKYDAVNKDLLPIVTKYIKGLEIDKISIEDAFFDMKIGSLDENTTLANHLSIVIYDFSLNSKNYSKNKDKFLYAKNVDLLVKDYLFVLPDHIHVLKAHRISISTKNGKLKAESVSIQPLDSVLLNNNNKFIRLTVPLISLDGFDFKNAYANSIVKVTDFILKNPTITTVGFQNKKKELKSATLNQNKFKINEAVDLYKLIKGSLKSVFVKHFNLSDAKYSSFTSTLSKRPNVEIQKFGIVFNHFLIDSLSSQRTDRILGSENFNINIRGLNLYFGDEFHELHAKHLYVSSNERLVIADDVELFHKDGSQGKKQIKNGVNFLVPSLIIKNINLHKAYNFNQIEINELSLNQPIFSLKKFDRDTLKSINSQPINAIIANYFNKLKINHLNLNSGIFEMQELNDTLMGLKSSGRISLHLNQFLFEPQKRSDTSKLFYAENFDLLVNDFNLLFKDKFHQLHLNEIRISSDLQLLNLDHLSIKPLFENAKIDWLKSHNIKNIIRFNINDLNCYGLDVKNIFEHRKVFADSIVLKQPIVDIRSFNFLGPVVDTASLLKIEKNIASGALDSVQTDSLRVKKNSVKNVVIQMIDTIKPYLLIDRLLKIVKEVKIGKTQIKNGRIQTEQFDSLGLALLKSNYKLGLRIDQLHLQASKLIDTSLRLPAKDIELILTDFERRIFKDKYTLNCNELGISTKKSLLFAKSLRLQPTKEFAAVSNKFLNIYIPSTKLYFSDLKSFFDARILNVDSLITESARIILVKYTNKENGIFIGDTSKRKRLIPDIIKSIVLKHSEFKNGMFAVMNEKSNNLKKNKVISLNFDLNVDDLPIDSSFLAKKIAKSCEITGIISNFFLKTKDSLHYMKADYVYLDTYHQKLDIFGYQLNYNSKLSDFQILSRLENFKKNNLLSIGAESAHFKGFDWQEAFKHKGMSFDKTSISGLDVKIINYELLRKKPIVSIAKFDLYELVKPITRYLNINELTFERGSIATKKIMDDSIKEFKLSNAKGKIIKLKIDSTRFDRSDLLASEDIQIEVPSFTLLLKDSIYKVKTGRIKLSTREKTVSVENLKFNSGRSLLETSKLYKFQKPTYDVSLDSGLFHQVDIVRFYDRRNFIATNAELFGMDFKTFANRKIINEIEPKKTRSPLMMLKKAKFYWDIDTIKIKNSQYSYEELSTKSSKTGYVNLTSIEGEMLNLKNTEIAIQNKLDFSLHAKARLCSAGNLTIQMKFPLNSTKDEFQIIGQLDSLDMTKINGYIAPTQLFIFTGGQLHQADFTIQGDSTVAKGKIKMLYNDFKFEVLSRKNENDKNLFKSLFANTLIRKNNPNNKLSLPRTGQIYMERDFSKSMISFWMKSLVVGVKSSLGFDSKEGKKERKIEKKELKKQLKIQKNESIQNNDEETGNSEQ